MSGATPTFSTSGIMSRLVTALSEAVTKPPSINRRVTLPTTVPQVRVPMIGPRSYFR
jgi:hypothetical protein